MYKEDSSANNPIKEIIFSISFSENIALDCLNSFISIKEIKEAFPVIKQGYKAQIKTNKHGNPPITAINQAGYILKCDEPCNRILQAKIGLFTFHKTKEYEPYKNLILELDEYWNYFQNCTGDLHITKISLRYLNFIPIEDNEKIEDYLKISTKSPFENLISNFAQLKFKSEEDNNTEVTMVTTNGLDNGKKGIILDIILDRKIDNIVFKNASNLFEGMQIIKNNIFQKTITEKTKQRYNL